MKDMLRVTGDITFPVTFAEAADEITVALCNDWHCRYAAGGIGLSGPADQLVIYRHPDPTSVQTARLYNFLKVLTRASEYDQLKAIAAILENEDDAPFVLEALKEATGPVRRAVLTALLAKEALTVAQIMEEGAQVVIEAALDQLWGEFGAQKILKNGITAEITPT